MDKTICFIEPPYDVFMEELDPPFPLMYLAAIAEQEGWKPQILDMNSLTDKLPDASVYGVTATSPQWPVALKLSKRLFDEHPEQRRVIGGSHISACPMDYYGSKFNGAVIGEGEHALADLLAAPSLFSRGITHGEAVQDLDQIPFPARHLIDWTKYNRGIYRGKTCLAKAVSIITSRGCPFNCIFCGSHNVFGRKVRFRSVENVVAEIKHVIDTMGYRGFNFHDDTFCINRERVVNLCTEFSKLDIVWRCLSRVDTVDMKLLKLMKDSGCQEIIYGIESGSQKILNLLNKRTTVKQNLKAMKLTKNSGIQLKVGIIVGSPGETWETVEETKKLLKQCSPDFWNVSVFTPFPGCAVWDNPEKYGLKILTRNLCEYSMVGRNFRGNVVVETEEMDKEDIEQARDELIDLCQRLSPL